MNIKLPPIVFFLFAGVGILTIGIVILLSSLRNIRISENKLKRAYYRFGIFNGIVLIIASILWLVYGIIFIF